MLESIKTKKANRESVALLKRQIKALNRVYKAGVGHESFLPIIEEKKSLLEFTQSIKTWNFGFEAGGWNSNQARTEEEAIKLAQKEYKGSQYTIVDPTSFRIATEADTQALLSLFY